MVEMCYFIMNQSSGENMSINIETNSYPITRRIELTNTATAISFPRDANVISIGANARINYSFEGNEGDTFGDGENDNFHFSFVPANNMCPITLEQGRQSNRTIYIATESASGTVSIVLSKG